MTAARLAVIVAVEQKLPPLPVPAMGTEIEALHKEHASLGAEARGADYPRAR